MTKLKYNLDEISDVSIEPGRYRARLTKCVQTMSTTQNPMLVWHWKIVTPGPAKGKDIRSFTSMLETALSNLANHLRAFGFSGKTELDSSELVGKHAVLVVGVREGTDRQGVTREFSNVLSVLPDGSPLDEEEEEEAPKKKRASKRVVEEEDEEDEEDYEDDEEEEEEDEEEEEEEAPAPKHRKSLPPSKSKSSKEARQRKLPF